MYDNPGPSDSNFINLTPLDTKMGGWGAKTKKSFKKHSTINLVSPFGIKKSLFEVNLFLEQNTLISNNHVIYSDVIHVFAIHSLKMKQNIGVM